ncbi:Glutamate--tRNA ligase, chloroplastic/mitochondrial [Ananas comosus]|nr:Glutamate--tRNA ligase, chloroplastic/mitochondrial [Ananas comosus]
MPLRVLLTGKLHGPDMGGSIVLIYKAGICGAVNPQSGFVPLDERLKILREIDWDALNKGPDPQPESVATVAH